MRIDVQPVGRDLVHAADTMARASGPARANGAKTTRTAANGANGANSVTRPPNEPGPQADRGQPMKRNTAAFTSAGRSSCRKCPAPSTVTCSDPSDSNGSTSPKPAMSMQPSCAPWR